MIPIPKFRLGTIFLIFFCYAIGLAETRDALGAIKPAIAVAILIGLGQEIRRLWRWTPPSPPPRASFTFARHFAIFWRCIVVFVTSRYFVLDFARAAFPPTSDPAAESSTGILNDFSLLSGLFPPAYTLCILIVLCNSIERWRPKKTISDTSKRRTRWLVLLAVPLVIAAVLNATLTMYLIHSAIFGIEAGQPAKFRRPGVYITPVDENLIPFWFGSLAVLSLLGGAVVLFRFIRRRNFAFASLWNLPIVPPLLAAPAIFSTWFFTAKFREFSPDMFGNGFEAGRTDWLYACILGVVVAVIVAHKIACSRDFCDLPITDVAVNPDTIPFHQTPPILFVIGLSGLYDIFVIGKALNQPSWPTSVGREILMMMLEPPLLLILAQSIACLQLCWIRWRYRAQPVPWRIAAMSRAAWYEGFIATLLLLAIGIPALHAFSFICWLMPWNVRALFGL